MAFMIVYLFCILAALGLGVLAGWNDFKGMTIPNFIPVLVLVSFFLCFAAVHFADADIFASLRSHLIAGGVILLATFGMYAARLIGGGDSKLVAAFSFWFGLKGLPVFLFYMVFAGAVFGVAAIVLKKKKPVAAPAEGSWVARVQAGESVVPYGIPIAIGAFAAFIRLGYLAPDMLRLFLVPN